MREARLDESEERDIRRKLNGSCEIVDDTFAGEETNDSRSTYKDGK